MGIVSKLRKKIGSRVQRLLNRGWRCVFIPRTSPARERSRLLRRRASDSIGHREKCHFELETAPRDISPKRKLLFFVCLRKVSVVLHRDVALLDLRFRSDVMGFVSVRAACGSVHQAARRSGERECAFSLRLLQGPPPNPLFSLAIRNYVSVVVLAPLGGWAAARFF